MDINHIETSVSKVASGITTTITPATGHRNPASSKQSGIAKLCAELSQSLRRPGSHTLRLIDKALGYLHPFESPGAGVTSSSEKNDLLQLIATHRRPLSPYLDLDRIESNLRCL